MTDQPTPEQLQEAEAMNEVFNQILLEGAAQELIDTAMNRTRNQMADEVDDTYVAALLLGMASIELFFVACASQVSSLDSQEKFDYVGMGVEQEVKTTYMTALKHIWKRWKNEPGSFG